MKKQIKKAKTIAEELATYKSEKFMELYFDMVGFFNDYFEKQAIEYIKNLENYPELKLNKTTDLEKFIEKLALVYLLWQAEGDDEIMQDLIKIWSSTDSITISNEYALEYAEKQAGLSFAMINETTSNTINAIITNWIKESQTIQDIATQIKEKFADFTLYRSTLIATMEVSLAYWEWQKKQYDEYSKKLWVVWYKRSVTQKDSNVRESHKSNEEAWWIRRDQVYPGTGTMNAPHWFMCRCHDVNSMVNPDTWMLYDKVPEYKDEQIKKFDSHWWSLDELNIDLKLSEKELQAKYNLKNQEIFAIKTFSWEGYRKYNDWYIKASSDIMFQSWIQFLLWWLNKLPKYDWKIYRWHKVSKKEFENLSNLVSWDLFSYNTFFSSSKSKKIAEWFMWDEYKVLFDINSKKWISIEEFSLIPAEKEVIFFPKTLFRVNDIEKNENNITIKLIDL